VLIVDCLKIAALLSEAHEKRESFKMNRVQVMVGVSLAALAMTGSADVLVSLDLTVENQLTMTATEGNSAITATGSDFTGILFGGFLGGLGGGTGFNFLVSSDFSSAQNLADATPSFSVGGGGSDFGLNIWDMSTDINLSFSEGRRAFIGSAVWTLNSNFYQNMLAGADSGNIYFPADDDGDIPGAEVLGTYTVVPAPSGFALLGLGGIVAGRRRR